jgi:AcrR family transcriptional regulator
MTDEDTKRQILGAAHELLSQMPYQKLTMGMVAEKAGVSKSLLFYHFGSKRELTREALKHGFNEVITQFDVIDDLDEETIRTILPELFRFTFESMFLFISFIEVVDMDAHSDDELAIVMRDMYRRFIGKLGDFLERRGTPFAHEKAMLLALAIDMFGMVYHVEEREPDIERYTNAVLDLIGLEVDG